MKKFFLLILFTVIVTAPFRLYAQTSECSSTITSQSQWDDCCDNAGASNQAPQSACDAFANSVNSNCSAAITNQVQYDDCCGNGGGSGQANAASCSAYEGANNMSAASNGACSPTNIGTPACYVQNCTGQAGQDSASCNSYATSYAMNDDGNTDCASISSDNVASCCDNTVNSPMCIAFQDPGSSTGAISPQAQKALSALNAAGGVNNTLGASTSTNTAAVNQALNIHLNNPLSVSTIGDAVNLILSVVIRIALPLIILFFIWSGLTFIFARGNPIEVARAKQMFLYTVIGTLLILGAWVITNAIIGTVNLIIS